jgi:CDP-diglyceride synthetase
MLKQRVITALLLLLLLLPALFYQKPEPFYVLTLVFIAAAGWEWARMNGLGHGSFAGRWLGLHSGLQRFLVGWPAVPSASPPMVDCWLCMGAPERMGTARRCGRLGIVSQALAFGLGAEAPYA